MGAGIIWAPVVLYVVLMGAFCALVGAKTSPRMGWTMAAGLVLLPSALLIGALLAAG